MTRKILIALLWGTLAVSVASAQTVIPGGYVSGTWTAAGSPYLVQGDITIHADSTLNINPGVEVNFQGFFSLTVNGLLEAVGTETDSIHFFPADTTWGWNTLRFENASDSSHLTFCAISHSGNNFFGMGGITCTNSNPVITHCRIRDNGARGGIDNIAGGIALNNSHAEISWCDISRNEKPNFGGGINITNSNPVITGCNISGNESFMYGGGVYITGNSSPMITGCTIERDTSNMYGGGISIAGGVITISECTVGYNRAYDGGGGLSISSGSVSLDHCTFERSNCWMWSGQGGGIFINGGTLTVDYSTFFADYVMNEQNGMEIHTGGSAAMTVTNSILSCDYYLIVFGSTSPASVSYNDFQTYLFPWYFGGNIPPGLRELTQVNANGDSCDTYSNIFLDPLFVDFNGGDYHLTAESPCIDAGDPASPYDPDGTVTDMGRYFFDQSIPGIEHDPNRLIPTSILLASPYPNPFNPMTTFRIELPEAGWVRLEVYDINGRIVVARSPRPFTSGIHHIAFDGSGLASGMYLYQLRAGNFTACGKMVLMK